MRQLKKWNETTLTLVYPQSVSALNVWITHSASPIVDWWYGDNFTRMIPLWVMKSAKIPYWWRLIHDLTQSCLAVHEMRRWIIAFELSWQLWQNSLGGLLTTWNGIIEYQEILPKAWISIVSMQPHPRSLWPLPVMKWCCWCFVSYLLTRSTVTYLFFQLLIQACPSHISSS